MKAAYSKLLWTIVLMLFECAGVSAAADQMSGKRIAERWCAECHVIASTQRQASDAVPSFAEIARSKRFDESSLATFLAAPHHSRMPNLSLTRTDIADLVAYIKRDAR